MCTLEAYQIKTEVSESFFPLNHCNLEAQENVTDRFLSPCRNKGASDPEEVSQCSREPSSEQVNKWSGFVG